MLSGWGGYPRATAKVIAPRDPAALQAVTGPVIARGQGRAYGDAAISPGATLDMRHFDRLLDFDPDTGELTAQAGVTLDTIIRLFLPRGFFPMVTPGTRFVSIGGAIAADVHGKNHHAEGSFCDHVAAVQVLGPEGLAWFDAGTEGFERTRGAMGLTGIITAAKLRLRRVESGWIAQRSLVAQDLDAALDLFETHHDAHYSVGWIDCTAQGAAMGRGLVLLGDHTQAPAGRPKWPKARLGLAVPFNLPGFALNPLTLRAFNALYFATGARKGAQHIDWQSYFYPLDALRHWPRLYGRGGFLQFQCVLPMDNARAGLRALLRAISDSGQGSPLAVLKRMGAQAGPWSFPLSGMTLALDFPVRPATLALMDRLDAITLDHGGRFYLAKDARMPRAVFDASDPRWTELRDWRARSGAADRYQSLQSQRLGL